jgi:hypothetical protein
VEQATPPWLAPPERELGIVLVVERDLARTEAAVVSVRSVTVHSTGFSVATVAARRPRRRTPGELEALSGHWHPHFGGEPPADLVRLGVQLADGRTATNVDPFPCFEEAPERTVLMAGGRGGGLDRQDLSLWIWPLPPPGRLELVCEWPAERIPVSRIGLDAEEILDAAARVEPLWPA